MKLLREIAYDKSTMPDSNLVNHYNKFDEEDKKNINNFTNRSFEMNNYHWNNHANPSNPKDARIEENTKGLDKALTKHQTPHNMTVYSGVSYHPKEMSSNKVLHHPAYMSTSIDKEIAKGFADDQQTDEEDEMGRTHNHVLKIHVPAGSHGAYVDHLSSHGGQREFILPRNTKLLHMKTISKPYSKDTPDYIQNIHHMRVIK